MTTLTGERAAPGVGSASGFRAALGTSDGDGDGDGDLAEATSDAQSAIVTSARFAYILDRTGVILLALRPVNTRTRTFMSVVKWTTASGALERYCAPLAVVHLTTLINV